MVSKNVVETVDTVYCRKSEQTEESAMKSLFEELGGTYYQEGDYFLPDLPLPETAPHIPLTAPPLPAGRAAGTIPWMLPGQCGIFLLFYGKSPIKAQIPPPAWHAVRLCVPVLPDSVPGPGAPRLSAIFFSHTSRG